MIRPLSALVVVLALSAPARAGVVMEFTDKSPGEAAPSVSKAFVTDDRVRIESDGHLMIFRGDKKVVWLVDTAGNTYMEMTESGPPGMAEAMKEMEAQLAAMSPEERAMVEGMMKQQMGAMAPKPAAPQAPIAWSSNGSSDTIGGRACKGFDGARGGRVEEVICAADWATFGLSPSDFEGLRAFGEFMKKMSGPMAQMAGQAKSGFVDPDMPGVPLRSVFKSPAGDSVHELTKLEKSGVDPSLFELPAGAKREEMEGMGGMGGGAPPRGGRGRH